MENGGSLDKYIWICNVVVGRQCDLIIFAFTLLLSHEEASRKRRHVCAHQNWLFFTDNSVVAR